jgi:hypothetical protein
MYPYHRDPHSEVPFIRGRPIPLAFLGWRSDTLTLQHAGWQFAERVGYGPYSMRLRFRHPEYRIAGEAAIDGLVWERLRNEDTAPTLKVSMGMPYVISHSHMENWIPVNTEPTIERTYRRHDLMDAPYFRPVEEGKEIFIREASIDEVLQIAMDKQAPQQAEIRARRRAEAKREQYRAEKTAARLIMVE